MAEDQAWEYNAPQYHSFARLSSGEEKECQVEVEDYFNYDHEKGHIPVSYNGEEHSYEGSVWGNEEEEEEDLGWDENKENEGEKNGSMNNSQEEVVVKISSQSRVFVESVARNNVGNGVDCDCGNRKRVRDQIETDGTSAQATCSGKGMSGQGGGCEKMILINQEVISQIGDKKSVLNEIMGGDQNMGMNKVTGVEYNEGIKNANAMKHSVCETPLSKVLSFNRVVSKISEHNPTDTGNDILISGINDLKLDNRNESMEDSSVGDVPVSRMSPHDDNANDDASVSYDGSDDEKEDKDMEVGCSGDVDGVSGDVGGGMLAGSEKSEDDVIRLERSFNDEALDIMSSPLNIHARLSMAIDAKRLSMSVDRGKALRQPLKLNPVKNGLHRKHILFGGEVEKELIKDIEKEEKKQQAQQAPILHKGQSIAKIKVTKVKPFSFESRMKEAVTKKEEFIRKVQQEQKAECSMFRAQPLPSIYLRKYNLSRASNLNLSNQKSSKTHHTAKLCSQNQLNLKQSSSSTLKSKHTTKPVPFVLQTDLRASRKEQINVQNLINEQQQSNQKSNQQHNNPNKNKKLLPSKLLLNRNTAFLKQSSSNNGHLPRQPIKARHVSSTATTDAANTDTAASANTTAANTLHNVFYTNSNSGNTNTATTYLYK